MNVLDKFVAAGQKRRVKKLRGWVDAINAFEPEMEALSDAELRSKTDTFRRRIAEGLGDEDVNPSEAPRERIDPLLEALLPEAFAVVREAARRTVGLRHFDVQLIGGVVLHQGRIAEMRTGEGKTLVATLPVYLNALAGKGVHLVTVNDYLARRDAEWMGRIYRFLGLEVGAIQSGMRPDERRPIYAGDVVYGTNSEFGFDYLRDNMAFSNEQLVQRGHHFAIVDEVDSILIDEARTPLIISGAAEQSAKWYYQFANIVRRLSRDRDYEVDEAKRTVALNEDGVHRVEELLGIENLYDEVQSPLVHYLTGAIKAKELYQRDQHYLVRDGEVVIVDEFTGRAMPGRRWSDGIHQSVEAKEGVRIKEEHQTLASVTIQNYFRMYEKLSGMTGTALTEQAEFEHIYDLDVVEVPTHMPMIREDHNDLIYKREDGKFRALIEDVAERHARGQPVLIGTGSVDKNEKLSRLLERHGIPHQVLNAKQHEREATIIAQAGLPGAVTVATNMAGRGVDIILGGNPEYEGKQKAIAEGIEPETAEFDAFVQRYVDERRPEWQRLHDQVVDAGGLFVLGTERHESRRIDNQLRGRSGRQGDPGASRFYISLEDDLMQRFAAERVSSLMERLRLPDEVPIEHKMVSKSIQRAQSQVEQQNFLARKNILKYDDVMNTQRQVTYENRRRLLEGEDIREQSTEMVEEILTATVDTYCPQELFEEEWDLPGLLVALEEIYPTKLRKEDLEGLGYQELLERVLTEALEAYEAKEQELTVEGMRRAERFVLLNVLDAAWRDHLYEMDYLQEGIGLRAMGQRDPLTEYRREAYNLFQGFLDRIKEDFTKYIFRVRVAGEQEPQERPKQQLSYTAPAKTSDTAQRTRAPAAVGAGSPAGGGAPSGDGASAHTTVRHDNDKVGRNDPCPCGSGKKYKKCHGAVGMAG